MPMAKAEAAGGKTPAPGPHTRAGVVKSATHDSRESQTYATHANSKTTRLPSHACWRGSAVCECDPPLYSHRRSSSDSRGAAPHRSASSCDHSARCATSLQRGRQWSCSVLPPERRGAKASRVECTSVLRVWLHTSGARGMRLASTQACLPAGVWPAIGAAPPTPPQPHHRTHLPSASHQVGHLAIW